MNRRRFFKMIAAAGGALTLPKFFLPEVSAEPERVPITMAWMQHVYASLWWGNQHPTAIYFSRSRWEELRDNVIACDRFTCQDPDRGEQSFRFNGADVCWRNIRDNVAYFINENRPMDLKFSRMVTIGELPS